MVIMVIMVIMTSVFATKLSDAKQRRITIDKDAWEKEGLQEGDFVKVTIEKIQGSKKT